MWLRIDLIQIVKEYLDSGMQIFFTEQEGHVTEQEVQNENILPCGKRSKGGGQILLGFQRFVWLFKPSYELLQR